MITRWGNHRRQFEHWREASDVPSFEFAHDRLTVNPNALHPRNAGIHQGTANDLNSGKPRLRAFGAMHCSSSLRSATVCGESLSAHRTRPESPWARKAGVNHQASVRPASYLYSYSAKRYSYSTVVGHPAESTAR